MKSTSLYALSVWLAVRILWVVSAHAGHPKAPEYGMNIDPLRLSQASAYNAYCDQVIASGITSVRLAAEWGSIETADGVYDVAMLARMDAVVNRLHAHGVEILWILAYTAPWASVQPLAPHPERTRYRPANWEDWEDFVRFISTRYLGKITHWEVWNEPDHLTFWKSSTADYATLLKLAYSELKSVDPENTVLMGGLAYTNYTIDAQGRSIFFDDMLAVPGVTEAFDAINYHAYGSMAEHLRRHAGILEVARDHGIESKPIWITETGYDSRGIPANEAVKADMVDQIAATCGTLANIEHVFFYAYRDLAEDFGMVGDDLSPLAASYFFQSIHGAELRADLQAQSEEMAPSVRALYYVAATSGDGSMVSQRQRIPAAGYSEYRVDDSWIYNSNESVEVEVTYEDSNGGDFTLEYDATIDPYLAITQSRTGTGTWQTRTITLPAARFANRQSQLTDFRLLAQGSDLLVSSVLVRRIADGSVRKLLPCRVGATDGAAGTESLIPVGKYMYLRANDGWLSQVDGGVESTTFVEVTYLDVGLDSFAVQYDSKNTAYQSIPMSRTNTMGWRTHTFRLAEPKFANRQNNAADLRIYAGSSELLVSSVMMYRARNPASVRMRAVASEKLMHHVTRTSASQEAYNPATTKGGVECRSITSDSRYFYFELSDAFHGSDESDVVISVTYWDEGADFLALEYNSATEVYKRRSVLKTNTGSWKIATFHLTDADFRNGQNYGADFRIFNGYDGSAEYVSRVDVTFNRRNAFAIPYFHSDDTETIVQYAFGLDSGESAGSALPQLTHDPSSGTFVLTFNRAHLDIVYDVMISDDLADWDLWQRSPGTPGGLVRSIGPDNQDGDPLFFKLRLSTLR